MCGSARGEIVAPTSTPTPQEEPCATHHLRRRGNEVTKNHTVSTRRTRGGTISGSIRVQYSFLIPKYPIGTFSIYSCLGNIKFSARPSR